MDSISNAGVSRRRSLAHALDPASADAPASFLGVSLAAATPATTVNPVQTKTYYLSQSNNPIAFGSGTKVKTTTDFRAVVGASNVYWKVINDGLLEGHVQGLYLKGAGNVTNSGIITGDQSSGVCWSVAM
jgi:hypothetical protein